MGITEDLADALAKDVIAAEEKLGDETLVNQISEVIGASSQTTQEAFLTAIRVRRAEARARRMLRQKLENAAKPQNAASPNESEPAPSPEKPAET
ncbi:hypothetical protein [Litoreibacter roseus]|uniref:Uncharacterized protein n=1 Tax=Litoreibacter roseus TaxID=2601869 RepID=A0A6N6JKZ2_9RHOB|nr:hypothetical protein [Litoreibacter roseus]GFE66617.1 hypothetical protein KIN_36910 [Litoreibacter roseus]